MTKNKDSIFLTGATGLVGSYVLREFLCNGIPTAVLVRNSRRESAEKRVRTLIEKWNEESGITLSVPKIIVGGLTDDSWFSENSSWFQNSCDSVIHCAASLTFNGRPDDEPWRSNIQGTKNILAACEKYGIRKLHYVSTAYVAGSSKIFKESDFNIGQKLRNDYEQSKFQAEKMVREADFIDKLTVYRPSIVVGDSRTGETQSFHGFYAVLKLAHVLARQMPFCVGRGIRTLISMGMRGNEAKNFVPVDWVSSVLCKILMDESLHGKTYHLTNPNPPLLKDFVEVIQEAVEKYSEFAKVDTSSESEDWFLRNYAQQIAIYKPYLQCDPQFGTENVQKYASEFKCPQMTKELMMFLAKQAIFSDFGHIPFPAVEPAGTC